MCLSRSVLSHGSRQAHAWLIFNVRQETFPMTTTNLNSDPVSSPDVRFYWWEIMMIAIGALIGLAFEEFAIGLMVGMVFSSAVSTYVDRKNPKSPTVVRIVGTVFATGMLGMLIKLRLVLPT